MKLRALIRRIKKLPLTAAKREALRLQGRRVGARWVVRLTRPKVREIFKDDLLLEEIIKIEFLIRRDRHKGFAQKIVRAAFTEGARATFKLVSW